jgi:hypothetical protein
MFEDYEHNSTIYFVFKHHEHKSTKHHTRTKHTKTSKTQTQTK